MDSLLIYYPQAYTGLDSIITNSESYSDIVDDMLINELNISEESLKSVASYSSAPPKVYYTARDSKIGSGGVG